jgi:hypothetical protein
MKLGVYDLRCNIGINGAPDVKQLEEGRSSEEGVCGLPGRQSVPSPAVHVLRSYLEALLARIAFSARWNVSKANCST